MGDKGEEGSKGIVKLVMGEGNFLWLIMGHSYYLTLGDGVEVLFAFIYIPFLTSQLSLMEYAASSLLKEVHRSLASGHFC
jgi:hypothetical protein